MVRDELDEYMVTDSIRWHFTEILEQVLLKNISEQMNSSVPYSRR